MSPHRLGRVVGRMLRLALPMMFALQAHAGSYDPLKIPDPRFSSFTPVLSGCAGDDAIVTRCPGTGTPSVGFVVRPRTIDNAVPLGHDVELYFVDPGLRLYAEQEPGVTFDCTLRVFHKTILSDTVVFRPRFGGHAEGQAIEVGADGVVLGYAPARSTDMDAQGGSTGLGDLTLFVPLYLAGATNHPEADFDGSGGPIGLGDFTIFAREYMTGATGAYCP